MATANDYLCDNCGQAITANPECPLVTYVSAQRVGGPGLLDPSGLSTGIRVLAGLHLPRIELCPACASEHVRLSPELVERLVEITAGVQRQITPEQAAKRVEDARAEHLGHVQKQAKKLGLLSTPKAKKEA